MSDNALDHIIRLPWQIKGTASECSFGDLLKSPSPVIMKCFGDKTKVHHCKVVLLDEQELLQEIQDLTTGQDLLDVVFKHLNLMETAYFGLRYLDPNNQTHWLDPVKKVSKQLKGTSPFTLYFSVKFYAADPCKLVEEITRYQFFLQVKQDILQGRLPVAEELAAELGAYAVQSELGDYDPRRHSPGYVSEFRFLTTQSTQLEHKIADLHKKLIGQVPSKAENCYLEKVKWLDMYGVDLHPVLGEDSIEYFLGLTPAGVIVLRNKAKVGNYFWPRIAKVYFRGRFFMLRVRDKNNSENTYGFETPSKGACKHLWQCCVEHHAFFRLTQATGTTPQAIFSLGSQFRYSGRTEKEVLLEASQKNREQPEFSRVPSRRFQRRIIEGATDSPRLEDGDVKPETRNTVSLGPTPVTTSSHMYRSKSLTLTPGSDSPRSTRSAPYPRGVGVGDSSGDRATLLTPRRRGESPHSTRSTPANTKDHRLSRRTSSVDSQSSVDSRGHRRHSHRRSRGRSSDGEGSECSSRGSKGSSRGHRRHRHRTHSDDSNEHGHRRHRRRKKDRSGSGSRSMVDSSEQWMAVQAGQAAVRGNAATVRDISHKSGYTPSGHETEADSHHHHSNKRRHRKHRSRSRSPSEEKKSRIPESIRKHLDFGLQTPGGMTEAELKEIPYTKIETAKTVKIKYSDSKTRSKHKSPRRSKSNNSDRNKDNPPADGESPPPPYTPAALKDGSKSNEKQSRVEQDLRDQAPPEEGRMVNGYHHPPPLTRSALVKTPDQELEDSIYRATPTHLTNDNHNYRYTNGSHKPVMVNGPSVKALVTNSVGSSPSFNHDSPSPPPFRDDGSNSSFASGSGFTTPNMMKNGANDRNSHFTAVLKPHPSPQSSVTSGISLGSSSVSISAESNESTNTMTSGSNTQHTTHTQLSSTSNSPDPDCQLNDDTLTTNDSPEPYYSNLSQYQNNLLYNQDLYKNLPQRKKDTTDKQTLYPSLEPMTQHSTNILIQYHDTENDSQPSYLSTPTPRPRPRSSIISSLRSSDTSTHIVQSYGPDMSHTPTNFQNETNSLQRSSYTSTLPRPSTVTSPNDVGIPLSSSVPPSNSGFESSTLPRPSNSSKTPMRTTGSQTNILRTTGVQTNPTNKGQTTPNTQQSPMGPEASTSPPSPNSTNLAHSALHWKVYNWDAYREQTEWSNSLGRNVNVQTPPVNQHLGGVGGRQRRGSAGSLELILGPLIQSALEHQQR